MSKLPLSIPDGYELTEHGVFPKEWDIKAIGEIASVSSGGTPNRKVKDFWDGDIPWVTTTLINGNDISYANEFITKKGLESSSAKMCKAGTILMAMYGQGKTRGKAGALTIDASINQACAAIEVNSSDSGEYILHTLNYMYEDIRELSNSGGQENLSSGIIKGIKLPLPSKSEQTAIANALSDVDALLTELEKLIAKKQAIKTATMQHLLTGKTRLPQFATYTEGEKQGQQKGTKPSELGEVPEDWDVQTVYELAEGQKSLFDDGDWIEAEYITDKGVRLIQTGNIGVGRYQEKENKKYISESSFIKLKCKELKQGDLLICRLAEPAGRACIFPDIGEEKIITSVDVTIFRPPVETVNREYLLHYFSTNEWFSSVLEQVGGTTHKRISRGALGRIRVPMPKLAEQTAIATILSDMDNEIQTLEQRLAKTRQIKQGMMQELLTGRTRLPFDKE
ncbi:restriction endonuclease subunit S [uncultured Pseudoalteromonas sp.]|uniref:restriction endonuclease subunit S n=1 Tax=uncultured Pseudoalteromonas sp. TaxID=114053 RepID=UPI0025968E8F|nr:restriction endonuclease subunit S [uncultured Pseudoalteromonas sp.]